MSQITEKIMRGEYVSKAECLEHAEEIERAFAAYGPAMAAMESYEREMQACTCEWDISGAGAAVRQHNPACPVHDDEE